MWHRTLIIQSVSLRLTHTISRYLLIENPTLSKSRIVTSNLLFPYFVTTIILKLPSSERVRSKNENELPISFCYYIF